MSHAVIDGCHAAPFTVELIRCVCVARTLDLFQVAASFFGHDDLNETKRPETDLFF